MASTDSDRRKQNNLPKVGQNVPLVYKNMTEAYTSKSPQGEESVYFRVNFSDGITLREFNPGRSVRKGLIFAERWGAFCSALGLDMDDMYYLHSWELFPTAFIDFTKSGRGKTIYAKLTLDENNWLIPGAGKCFSDRPDLVFTEEDTQFLPVEFMEQNTHFQ